MGDMLHVRGHNAALVLLIRRRCSLRYSGRVAFPLVSDFYRWGASSHKQQSAHTQGSDQKEPRRHSSGVLAPVYTSIVYLSSPTHQAGPT